MFSLIISIIAIALAAVLLLTSAFYGGDSLTQGTSKAKAAALANEVQQISAGYDLHKVENGGVAPATVEELVTDEYLKQAPATGWALGTASFDGTDFPSYVTPDNISDEVCAKVADRTDENGVQCVDSDAGAAPDNNIVSFKI